MADYIERAALLHKFNIDDMMNVNGTLISLNDARQTIENAPAADVVEVRHGVWWEYGRENRWLRDDGKTVFMQCSECREPLVRNFFESAHYCPNCGAKMEDSP